LVRNQQFALATYNRASMPIHLRDHLAAGRHIPGVFVLRRKMTVARSSKRWARFG
jgi:hypothetical protein